ncbi:3-ketoacyl-ACP reductase [Nitrincola sp.]|uniref:3-ketoacyl-ACP reductase n=1 Tax=Nitrincola sp. TaxID=1926584 RepID=UPI003A8DC1F2
MTKPVVLITGASGGIGLAIAVAMGQSGFNVALNSLPEDKALNDAVTTVQATGAQVIAVPGDVADLETHNTMLDLVQAHFGRLDCLINNAGVSVMSRGDLLDVSTESFDRCHTVNTRGTFFLTQNAARRMLTTDACKHHRSIINITSSNAVAVSVNRGEYCISKAASSMGSRLFAQRLASAGIGVYEIQPGLIETQMTAPSKPKYDVLIEQGLTSIPRWGQPEEVASVAVSMANGNLPYTVGQEIRVDGGLMMPKF